MNFQIAGTGRSFKGAFAYYLHDKRADPSQPHLMTAERVGWMETRHLAVDDPACVQGVMIATARSADDLKRAAGVKMTGRKATAGPVFAYSLQWHPENETIPDRAGMVAAAEATLRALGAEGRQAAIIAHRDTAHPHVHIIVNRVDPETGRMLDLNDNAKKLDAWARRYERERGEIVSPAREAKYQEQEARQQEKATAALEVAKPESAKVAPAKERPKTVAAHLAERQTEQKDRHKQEWADLAAANKERRGAVYDERIDFKAIARDHRTETKPQWSEFGKRQWSERGEFQQRERRLSGVVKNAMGVARDQQRRGVADDRGFLSMTFAYTLNSQARRDAFIQRQAAEKELLKRATDAALMQKFEAAKAERAAKLAEVRKTYDADRAALISRQDLERDQIRAAWRKIYTDREKLEAAKDRSRERMGRSGDENFRRRRRLDRATWPPSIDNQAQAPGPTPQQEQQPVKRDFERSAAKVAPANLGPAPTVPRSVAVPAPAPAPEGVPQPSARRVENVPAVDQAKEWGKSKEGQQATRGKAEKAPGDLRRAYQPAPEKVAPAKETPAGTAAPAKAKDYWQQATRPKPDAPPVRDYWTEAAKPRERPAPRKPGHDFDRER
ncbi:relaxase/mobilization nuclease domain-containing protein [Roseomonas sp. CECT 9278]|uniref:relaxase/mobilization nuclease domain-containing protein n=1 Tax=Roseomonas sp. CECT 9278 TaxID=2845823 RepID=UPI001E52DDA9|nr:relaxase/mobilization nuclease domain-containing protein [Roseomonas sp. CECT 9278]CAH0313417.1 hypothetical protein ROS9278_05033 [Roseomonas sp. CECT 9278]